MVLGEFDHSKTFDSFVVGSHNQFAHAAALAVAREPGTTYNPLYIYGGGVEERTHLLQAIGLEIDDRNKQFRILYLPTKSFIAGVLEASKSNECSTLRIICEELDVLLMDEIEDISGNEYGQNEFYSIFSTLYDKRKQIVLTSSHLPRDIPLFEERLRSRLSWGLIADIHDLDIETLVAIVMKKASLLNISISKDAALLIAQDKRIPMYGLDRVKGIQKCILELSKISKKKRFDRELIREYISGKRCLENNGIVQLVDASPQIIEMLKKDYSYIFQINPDEFELLVCEFLSRMDLEVKRIKSVYSRDGGIDIIAWPRDSKFPYLLATQVKHHRDPIRRTGPAPVRELQGIISCKPFQSGLLVTNTSFTPDAKWFAANKSYLIRLRDMNDLKKWIWNNYSDPLNMRDIPSKIELAPNLIVDIPRIIRP